VDHHQGRGIGAELDRHARPRWHDAGDVACHQPPRHRSRLGGSPGGDPGASGEVGRHGPPPPRRRSAPAT
jgi:hypothetical protein